MTEDRAPYRIGGSDEINSARERLERDMESLIAAFVARTGVRVTAVRFSEADPTVRVFIEGDLRSVT